MGWSVTALAFAGLALTFAPAASFLEGVGALLAVLSGVYLFFTTIAYLVSGLTGSEFISHRPPPDTSRPTPEESAEYWQRVREPRFNYATRWPAPHPAIDSRGRRRRSDFRRNEHRASQVAIVIGVAIVVVVIAVVIADGLVS